jgi:hypothetical protein
MWCLYSIVFSWFVRDTGGEGKKEWFHSRIYRPSESPMNQLTCAILISPARAGFMVLFRRTSVRSTLCNIPLLYLGFDGETELVGQNPRV